MLNLLLWLLVGWPAILVTLGLAMYGLSRKDYRFLVAAAILAVPFSWYLSGFPVVRSPVFLAPALIFGSAWAMRRGSEMLAWLLVIPAPVPFYNGFDDAWRFVDALCAELVVPPAVRALNRGAGAP